MIKPYWSSSASTSINAVLPPVFLVVKTSSPPSLTNISAISVVSAVPRNLNPNELLPVSISNFALGVAVPIPTFVSLT